MMVSARKLVFLLGGSFWLMVAGIGNANPLNSFDVMFYNVENLFDTEHDVGKDDWTWLPKDYPGKAENCAKNPVAHYRKLCLETDWTPEKLAIKIDQKARAIKASGPLPALLGVAEIENDNVTAMLAAELGYKSFRITTGPDKRGIEVALLFNESEHLEYIKHRSIRLTGANFRSHPTRDILEVEFLVRGKESLLVYVNHWPSPAAPGSVRAEVARQLRAAIAERLNANPNHNVLLLGDFNTIDSDNPHPFNTELLAAKHGIQLHDVHQLFSDDDHIDWSTKKAAPLGTHFYVPDMSWNRLDRFFINDALRKKSGLMADHSSYQIVVKDFLTKNFTYNRPGEFLYGTTVTNIPMRYDFSATHASRAGFSDHFPIRMSIRVN